MNFYGKYISVFILVASVSASAGGFFEFLSVSRSSKSLKSPDKPSVAAELNLTDAARVEQIKDIISNKNFAMNSPISDREYWIQNPQFREQYSAVIVKAESFLNQPFPKWQNSLYLDFFRTGVRERGETMISDRTNRLFPLVFAEAFENRGRFINEIEKTLNEIVSQPSWTLPAHDANQDNLHGRSYSVDLWAAKVANSLAHALFILEKKISPEIRQKTMDALEMKVFSPIRQGLISGEVPWWMLDAYNWNPVCLSGVVNAALAILPKDDRALFVFAAEKYGPNYLRGYSSSGYAQEGPGYWEYGFSHFIRLRESVAKVTSGKIDLFTNSATRAIALYGPRITMTGGQAPPFSDSFYGVRISSDILSYVNQVFDLGLDIKNRPGPAFFSDELGYVFFSPYPLANKSSIFTTNNIGLSSYFSPENVLVSRTSEDSQDRLSAAIKSATPGGHSHQDIGSYVITMKGQEMAGDQGGPTSYTADSWGPNRYKSKLLNSYGHPVPLVASKTQLPSEGTQPRVIQKSLQNIADTFELDMTSAYNVVSLKKLIRKYTFLRSDRGSVMIQDSFDFTEPQSFETAIITRNSYRLLSATSLEILVGDEKMLVEVKSSDAIKLVPEKLVESGVSFYRIAVSLIAPSSSGYVTITYTPR